MADLWERLKAAQAAGPKAPEPAAEPPAAETAPEGWEWTVPLVARRRLTFPVGGRFWKAFGPLVDPAAWDGVLAFDTETTGLSGGAGTVAFLVGWARLVPGGPEPSVEVTQYFLRDHPGEPDLVAALDAEFRGCRGLVSFNGASFDLPLLRSRWTLAGRSFPELPHRDDLHPARRLWKTLLENCRLGTLEEAVLGLNRVDDVPGALVPELWFSYLRSGAGPDFTGPLEGVLRHHAQDVYSLLCLDLLLAALRENPALDRWKVAQGRLRPTQRPARPAPAGLLHPDPGAETPVGFWGLLALRDRDDADHALEEAWSGGDESVGLAWADRLKRRGDPLAAEVWGRLWTETRSYPALEELLKWLEHADRSPVALDRALGLAAEGLSAPFLPAKWRQALEKRRDRLRRKARPSEAG